MSFPSISTNNSFKQAPNNTNPIIINKTSKRTSGFTLLPSLSNPTLNITHASNTTHTLPKKFTPITNHASKYTATPVNKTSSKVTTGIKSNYLLPPIIKPEIIPKEELFIFPIDDSSDYDSDSDFEKSGPVGMEGLIITISQPQNASEKKSFVSETHFKTLQSSEIELYKEDLKKLSTIPFTTNENQHVNVVLKDNQVIGAARGTSFDHVADRYKETFLKKGDAPEAFYFAEIAFLKGHLKKGYVVQLIMDLFFAITSQNSYAKLCICLPTELYEQLNPNELEIELKPNALEIEIKNESKNTIKMTCCTIGL